MSMNIQKVGIHNGTYLARELVQLALDGEVPGHDFLVMLLSPGQDLLHGERFVVRHTEVLDFRGLDQALVSVGHVTEMPGGDGVLGGTVGAHVHSEEVVGLILALELGGELCLGNPGSCWPDSDLLVWLHPSVAI